MTTIHHAAYHEAGHAIATVAAFRTCSGRSLCRPISSSTSRSTSATPGSGEADAAAAKSIRRTCPWGASLPSGGVARRRRFPTELKLAVVAETMQPGLSISYVARRHGLSCSAAISRKPDDPALDGLPLSPEKTVEAGSSMRKRYHAHARALAPRVTRVGSTLPDLQRPLRTGRRLSENFSMQLSQKRWGVNSPAGPSKQNSCQQRRHRVFQRSRRSLPRQTRPTRSKRRLFRNGPSCSRRDAFQRGRLG